MLTNIKKKKYDLVVYGSLKHGLSCVKDIRKIHLNQKFTVLNGYDEQTEEKYKKIFKHQRNITMFIRELESKV